MKAAVFKRAGLLEVEDVPRPSAGPGQVVIKVAFCAICGSDLHRFQHGLLAPGVILGHEYTGTVVEVGAGVESPRVGERVIKAIALDRPLVLPPRFNARTRGITSDIRTPGGFAEYVAASADSLIVTPDSLTDEAAALAEPLAVAVHTVRSSSLRIGDSVVVLGAGPVGLFVIQCIRHYAPKRLIVVEPSPARRELALKLGADIALDPRAGDPVAAVVGLTDGRGADIIVECAGAKPTLQQALEMARWQGEVTLVSLCMEPCTVSPAEWVASEVRLRTVYAFQPEDWRTALDLLGTGRVVAEPLISETVPLAAIQEAFLGLLEPRHQLQVVVRLGEGE